MEVDGEYPFFFIRKQQHVRPRDRKDRGLFCEDGREMVGLRARLWRGILLIVNVRRGHAVTEVFGREDSHMRM